MAQISFVRRNKAIVSKMIMMIMKMGDVDDGVEVEEHAEVEVII
jgi:hypothetical protein